MSTEESPTPRNGTTASIDRRVERLEQGHAEMQRTVDRLELGQTHLKEVVTARFGTVEAVLAGQNEKIVGIDKKIDEIKGYIQSAVNDSIKADSDPEATLAGRYIIKEMQRVNDKTEERNTEALARDTSMTNRLSSIEKKVWLASGGLAVLVFLANLFAPIIQGWFGISVK